MDGTSDREVGDRLRALDPLGGTARRYLDADVIVHAVAASHHARRRRAHRLVLAVVPVLLAAVALPLVLGRTPATGHGGGTLGLGGDVRVVHASSASAPPDANGGEGQTYYTNVPAALVFSTGSSFSADAKALGSVQVFTVIVPPGLEAARQLAASFGVPRRPVSIHGPEVVVGPVTGAHLAVAPRGGVLRWTYVARPNPTLSATGTPTADTLSQSVDRARAMLSRLDNGYGVLTYSPPSAVLGRTLSVSFSMVLDGEPTDLGTTFVFGPDSVLERASGAVVRLRGSGTYAALSPGAALSVLRSTSFCTLEPQRGHGRSRPEVVRVHIEHASARFTTFEASRHRSVLVPVWRLAGPAVVKGSMISQFAFDVVSLRPNELRIEHPRCTPVG